MPTPRPWRLIAAARVHICARICVCVVAGLAGLAAAPPSAPAQPLLGPSTNKPLPRFVSMRYARTNMRRGPDRDFAVEWVLTLRRLPLLVIDEYRDWRRVRDPMGEVGWISASQLSSFRTALAISDGYVLRSAPRADAAIEAPVARGAILEVVYCEEPDSDGTIWCRFTAQGFEGWGPSDGVWGAVIAPKG